jgi:hypothetical protein
MSSCALCQKPVVVSPDVLSDGRLVHADCKRQRTLGSFGAPRQNGNDEHPKSGTRIRAAKPVRRTG